MHPEQLGLSSGESFNEEKGHSFVKGHHWLHAFQLNLVSGFSFSSFLSSFAFSSFTSRCFHFCKSCPSLHFHQASHSLHVYPLFVPLKFCSSLHCYIFLSLKKAEFPILWILLKQNKYHGKRQGTHQTLYIPNQNHPGYLSSKDQTRQDYLLRPNQLDH